MPRHPSIDPAVSKSTTVARAFRRVVGMRNPSPVQMGSTPRGAEYPMYDRFLPLETTGDKDGCGGTADSARARATRVGGVDASPADEAPWSRRDAFRDEEHGVRAGGKGVRSPDRGGSVSDRRRWAGDRRRLDSRGIGFGLRPKAIALRVIALGLRPKALRSATRGDSQLGNPSFGRGRTISTNSSANGRRSSIS